LTMRVRAISSPPMRFTFRYSMSNNGTAGIA
jgi:hypothetical protein